MNNNDQQLLTTVRNYFNKESKDYCTYFDDKTKHKSFMRNISRLVSKNAIHGRRTAVIELCPSPLENRKICEVGTGGGHYATALAKQGASVLGLDFAENMINNARQMAEKEGVLDRCRFQQADIFEFKTDEKFDAVFAAGVIDYIPPARQQDFVKKLASLSNHSVIVSFPKKFHYHAFCRKIWLTAKGVPVWYFTSRKIIDLFEGAGLKVDREIDVGILKVVRAVHKRS